MSPLSKGNLIYDKITLFRVKENNNYQSKCAIENNCIPKIQEITSTGLVKVYFPIKLFVFDSSYYVNISRAINVSLQLTERSNQARLTGWEVIEFQP